VNLTGNFEIFYQMAAIIAFIQNNFLSMECYVNKNGLNEVESKQQL